MDLPSCALTCFIGAVSNSTCAISDFACICTDAQIGAELEPCVLSACTVKEALHTKNLTYTACGYPTSNDATIFPLTNLIGILVATLAVALRVSYRAIDRRLGFDDIMIIISLLFAAAISGIGLKLRDYGLGKDIWTIPFDDIRQTLKLFFIEEALYCICVALIKISMLLLYLRLFPNSGIRVAVLLFSALQLPGVFVICIPMPTLWNLQMPLEKRLGVCIMFAVGIVVTVISIFRLVETVGFNSTTNPTKDFVPVGIWSLLEFDVAIMCACLPAIRALFLRFYMAFIKEPIESRISSARNKFNSAYGSNSGAGSCSRARSQDPYHVASKPTPDNLEQFIQLEEMESGNDSLSTLPTTKSPKTKRHSIFSRRSRVGLVAPWAERGQGRKAKGKGQTSCCTKKDRLCFFYDVLRDPHQDDLVNLCRVNVIPGYIQKDERVFETITTTATQLFSVGEREVASRPAIAVPEKTISVVRRSYGGKL
ncbi:CFEM domain-containing protein [Aspergillus granulosus]|uniref:CFEM domain-containing protein n=1 Tax=Aspergillus granulosus TaxID=176169 RepID=A0ABR4H018_9EURO